MFGFKKKESSAGTMTWQADAVTALEQALAQMPVPGSLKGRVRSELEKAAVAHAREAGRSEVTAQDLMEGLLAKLPANMRGKVEEAMKQGPEGLEKLQKELK